MVVLALSPRPMSPLPAERLPQSLFCPADGDVELELAPRECNGGEEKGDSPDTMAPEKYLAL